MLGTKYTIHAREADEEGGRGREGERGEEVTVINCRRKK